MINQKKTLLSIAVGVVLAGCGGGGSDYVAPVVQPSITTSGKAIDGYLSGSLVVCDTNNNGVADGGEATTTTNGTGDFTFPSACAATIVVSGGTNIDTGLPFKGLLKAPAGSIVATPLTTLMADGGLTAAQVAAALGLPAGTDVTKLDPVLPANFELQKKTLAIQLILQQSAEALGGAAGDSSPSTLRAIYSEVAKSLGATLATATVPLIDASGVINPTVLVTIVSKAVDSLKASTNPALAAVKVAAANVSASTLANQFATQAQTLLKAATADSLRDVVQVLDDAFFAAQTNFLSIANDTIGLNGNNYTLANFATGRGVVLPAAVSSLDTVRFVYDVKGTPIPANAQGVMTTRVSLGVELSDTTTSGRKLEFILDQADVSLTGAGQLAVTVPAGAKLYAYGKTANGTTANVTLTNIAADQFVVVTNNQLSFNAGKVLTKLVPAQATFSGLQNIKGTFNLKVVVSNLNIAGQTQTSVQGLSVSVTGTNTVPTQSMSGLGVQGKFTVQ